MPPTIDLFPDDPSVITPHGKESIRDRLERDAWRKHRDLANRRAQAQLRRCFGERRNPPPKRSLRWQDRALLILSMVLVLLLIIRIESAQAQEDNWGLEFCGDGASQRSLALDTDVSVEITGLIARTQVSQVFENTGGGWAEAVYRYPLPDGAAVDRMRIEVGSRVLEGQIEEKQAAERQYQQARSNGNLATLVEQQRANQFETRLANIGPGEKIRVSISVRSRID